MAQHHSKVATQCNKVDVARALIAAGANLDAIAHNNATLSSATRGHKQIEMLLEIAKTPAVREIQ